MAKSEAAAVKEPVGQGKLKLIIVIILALLLAIGLSVGATWYFMHNAQSKVAATPAEASTTQQPAIYESMAPPFVANFKDANGRQRYLQVSITMMARNSADLEALKVHMPVIRNNLVMLFSGQTYETLATPVGQELLRQKATASVQEVAQKEIGKVVVEQLLFTNYVLQ
ncbi:flagellar basal body-associated protein FliL [Pseudomonas agarici]|uniref:Flagellar protein FliL n=1 Tax=Pseudomonas agarici TaxID=46677 RepID=A0A0X1SZS3_PSEAA|nr:flagellar basal body-associated protein FliL [Pseudomonas agarici]AMB85314.1 flagellar basal body-associated protein FliL [Pseudomonas agarici]NWC11239.1 flagellar basal body-associated protein FliL [Pseudomonas agarici]SEL73725.1 flagellar FliL protein [Pseudomonas agarici]